MIQDSLGDRLRDGADGLSGFFGDVANSVGYFGEVMAVILGVFSFLGIGGTALFFLSLILLGFVGAFSPLTKTTNYLLVVIGVTLIIVMGVGDLTEAGETMSTLMNYLAVMLVPLVVVYGLRIVLKRFGRGSETEQLREAVTELTEQVAALRRDRQGENADEDRGGIRGRYAATSEEPVAEPAPQERRPTNLRLVRRR